MDSRERVYLALNFEEPDRVPVDFWGSPGFYRKLKSARGTSKEEFLDAHDVDFRYIEGPSYVGPPLDSGRDIWGVPRRDVTLKLGGVEETYKEVTEPPLVDIETDEEIEAYDRWPSVDWLDYSGVKAQCEAVRRRGRIVIFMGDRLNRVAQLKPAMYIRGVSAILEDMLLRPGLAHTIFAKLRSFYKEYLVRILEAADGLIDIVLAGDDFGAQSGLLVSPRMWKTFLEEGFREYVSIIKAHGAKAMHHSCGCVTSIVPMMVGCGLDVLQSLQPEAMAADFPRLKNEFGDRLAFHGGMSIQKTLPFGSKEDVRKEVADRVSVLGRGGGYIISTAHNVQVDCPLENIDALFEAYCEFGTYKKG